MMDWQDRMDQFAWQDRMDQFAASAMIGLLAGGVQYRGPEELAERAWTLARAMEEARDREHRRRQDRQA